MYAFRFHILKLILFFLFTLISGSAFSWGFWAHQRINRMAVYALPKPLFYYYKKHIDELEKWAVNPDKRRYAVEGEAACHYIDLDHYGEDPFDSIPKSWSAAVESGQCTRRRTNRHGDRSFPETGTRRQR